MIRVEPAFHERAVPVAFSTDDNYAPLLAVAMRSALDNADPSFNYDILILNEGLAGANRERLLDPAGGNVSIRLVDMAEHMRGAATDFFVSRHIKIATYYRFFLPDILREYDKALYLDSDLVVLGDISALFATDLGDNLLAAAPEPIFMADVLAEERNNVAGGWRDYFVGTLGLRDPAAYVQAGVLVFNLAAMRRFGFADGCLDRLRTVREPVVHDQDILNAVCQGRILRLGLEWNHMCMAGGDGAGVGSGLPDDIRLELSRAAAAPKIIHYTTGDKAWLHRDSPYFEPFWRYAARTPFHGEHLARLERAERERAAPAGPERLRLVAKRHYDAFERYRDAHRGRDVVLIATGPSLARYRPFAGAIHLGVNRAFLRDDVRLDYLFVQPFFGSEIQAGRIAALGSVSPRKFHGMGLAGGQTAKMVDLGDGEVYYYREYGDSPSPFVADITAHPLAGNGSVVFPALQFALFTRPERLFLVGCDATGKGNLSAAAAGGGEADRALAAWRLLADFARREYPGVRIISVNPERLAGLFEDVAF